MPEVTVFFTIATLLTGRHAVPVVSSSSCDPASIKASLGADSSSLMLAGLHADLPNIAPARLFVVLFFFLCGHQAPQRRKSPPICLNHSNPHTLCFGRFIYKVYHIIKTLLVVNILALLF